MDVTINSSHHLLRIKTFIIHRILQGFQWYQMNHTVITDNCLDAKNTSKSKKQQNGRSQIIVFKQLMTTSKTQTELNMNTATQPHRDACACFFLPLHPGHLYLYFLYCVLLKNSSYCVKIFDSTMSC